MGYHEILFLPLWSGMHLTTFGFWFRPRATSRSGARARFMVKGGITRPVGGIKGNGFSHVVGPALDSGKLFWVEAVWRRVRTLDRDVWFLVAILAYSFLLGGFL